MQFIIISMYFVNVKLFLNILIPEFMNISIPEFMNILAPDFVQFHKDSPQAVLQLAGSFKYVVEYQARDFFLAITIQNTVANKAAAERTYKISPVCGEPVSDGAAVVAVPAFVVEEGAAVVEEGAVVPADAPTFSKSVKESLFSLSEARIASYISASTFKRYLDALIVSLNVKPAGSL